MWLRVSAKGSLKEPRYLTDKDVDSWWDREFVYSEGKTDYYFMWRRDKPVVVVGVMAVTGYSGSGQKMKWLRFAADDQTYGHGLDEVTPEEEHTLLNILWDMIHLKYEEGKWDANFMQQSWLPHYEKGN